MFLVLIWVRALLGRASSVGAPQGYVVCMYCLAYVALWTSWTAWHCEGFTMKREKFFGCPSREGELLWSDKVNLHVAWHCVLGL